MTRSKCYLSMFCVTYSLRILTEWWWRQSVRVKRMTMPVVHAELVMGYVDDKLIQNQQSYLSKIIHLNQHHPKTQAPTEQKTEAIIFKKNTQPKYNDYSNRNNISCHTRKSWWTDSKDPDKLIIRHVDNLPDPFSIFRFDLWNDTRSQY